MMNSTVFADDVAIGGHEFASSVGQGIALLSKVGVKKVLVVAARDETNFLRIRLLGESESVMARQIANFGLSHFSQGKQSAAELLLGESEQEICLILGAVGGTLQQPAPASLIELHTRIVTSSKSVCANLLGHNQKLIKLQVIVAQAARDRSPPGEIFLDKGTHHVTLESVLVIDHVVRNAESFGYATGIVNIIERTTAALNCLRHPGMAGETALIP